MRRFKYSQVQVDFIIQNYKNMQIDKLVEEFNRHFSTSITRKQIANKIKQIGITKRNIKENYGKYTDEMMDWLSKNHNTVKLEELVEKFNKHFNTDFSKSAIWHKINRTKDIKYNRTREYVPRLAWTEDLIAYLKDNYDHHSYYELSNIMNEKFNIKTTASSLEHKVHRLGLKKSEEGIAKSRDMKTASKFWFQKGHRPPLMREVGHEVLLSGYRYVKVKDPNVWKFKHRLVWEQAHGEIPDDHVVIFLDGDKKNCNLDNLKMISRAELMGLTQLGIEKHDADITNISLQLVKLKLKISERTKSNGKKQVNRST